jgi:molybdopterin-guanine dinucleotide biosynthesis protein A
MWTVVIQAGGLSSRMGKNKALVEFRGQPMIARVMDRIKDLGEELLIVVADKEGFGSLDARIEQDLISGLGPLGGLYTALYYAQNPYVLAVACDMPFLSRTLLHQEQDLLISGGYDVVVPSLSNGLEPLHAVYRREICLGEIGRAIRSGEKKLISWFSKVRVRRFEEYEIRHVDKHLRSFWNINTREDLETAEKLDQEMEI